MRTKDAVSPMPGLQYSLVGVTVVYALLTLVVGFVSVRLIHATEAEGAPEPLALTPEEATAHG
jgi:hypothetical protein